MCESNSSMVFLEWDETYSVGVREIDEQHKELMGLINALHALKRGNNQELLSRVLATLVEYTKKHFYLEEKLMAEMNFPDLEPHKRQHQSFVGKMAEFQRLFTEGHQPLSEELLEYLRMWLTSHILVQDKGYASYRQQRHIYS